VSLLAAQDVTPPGALDAGLRALGLALPGVSRDALLAYVALLAKWNRTYNLTAIREPEKMVTHHLLDCLAAIPAIEARMQIGEDAEIIDVGSGAGLPGIPFAIARPRWHVVMLEPVHKKASFIAQAIAELGLRNASVAPTRVEDHAATPRADVVVSRAFSDLASFAASSARHLAPGGRLVAMKGVHPHEELLELPSDCTVDAVVPVQVPGIDAARHLVFVTHAPR
jgi:16S rRNA (guanine527-N7)-methyltransferase